MAAWLTVEILQKGGITLAHAESDLSVFAPFSGDDIMIMYRASRTTRPKTRPIYAPLVLL